jgi:hypothetical protein
MLIYEQQNCAKVTGSKEVKSKSHELNNLLSELSDQGGSIAFVLIKSTFS